MSRRADAILSIVLIVVLVAVFVRVKGLERTIHEQAQEIELLRGELDSTNFLLAQCQEGK